jgi:hypothetical protein
VPRTLSLSGGRATGLDHPPQADGGGAGTASERPTLHYQTRATTYPGRRSRTEDSTRGPPLRRSDLVHWSDPDCSYTRIFTYDPAARRYRPDSPLPPVTIISTSTGRTAPPGE